MAHATTLRSRRKALLAQDRQERRYSRHVAGREAGTLRGGCLQGVRSQRKPRRLGGLKAAVSAGRRTLHGVRSGDVGRAAVDIFISWSGEPSRTVALKLRQWLPLVVPMATAWMSEEDIPKGTEWFTRIREVLDTAPVGLAVVTPGNWDQPWIHFEAGGMSQLIGSERRCCPVCVGMSPSELGRPLSLLNATDGTDKADMRRLLSGLLPEGADASAFSRHFESYWSELEAVMTDAARTPTGIASRPPLGLEDRVEDLASSVQALLLRLERQEPQGGSVWMSTHPPGWGDGTLSGTVERVLRAHGFLAEYVIGSDGPSINLVSETTPAAARRIAEEIAGQLTKTQWRQAAISGPGVPLIIVDVRQGDD
jgi:hypothetical protein